MRVIRESDLMTSVHPLSSSAVVQQARRNDAGRKFRNERITHNDRALHPETPYVPLPLAVPVCVLCVARTMPSPVTASADTHFSVVSPSPLFAPFHLPSANCRTRLTPPPSPGGNYPVNLQGRQGHRPLFPFLVLLSLFLNLVVV